MFSFDMEYQLINLIGYLTYNEEKQLTSKRPSSIAIRQDMAGLGISIYIYIYTLKFQRISLQSFIFLFTDTMYDLIVTWLNYDKTRNTFSSVLFKIAILIQSTYIQCIT